jgi:hypothetical protein
VARRRTDRYLNLPLDLVARFDWRRFNHIVEQDCRYARVRLVAEPAWRAAA